MVAAKAEAVWAAAAPPGPSAAALLAAVWSPADAGAGVGRHDPGRRDLGVGQLLCQGSALTSVRLRETHVIHGKEMRKGLGRFDGSLPMDVNI